MRTLFVLLLLTTAGLAGCLGDDATTDDTPAGGDDGIADPAKPYAVVMVHDSGFNPYHIGFRDDSPRAYQHPSTYLPGYPEDAIALPITLDAPDLESALKADCDLWTNVTYGQQYWFPGTKFVSVISFNPGLAGVGAGDRPNIDCSQELPAIGYRGGSHGTMTSSRATSNEYGACKRCLLGMVIGYNVEGVRWIGEQGAWVDVQSHSWGPVAPVFSPVDTPLTPIISDPSLNQAIEEGAQNVLSFWASGNGAATRGGVIGHPSFLTPHFGPSVIIVGGHDSGYINTWPGFTPHVISDSCNSWAAYHDSQDGSDDSVGGGTSGATPFAAGIAADLLVEARTLLGDVDRTGRDGDVMAAGTAPANVTEGPLADGVFTVQEWKDVLYKTSTARPDRQYEDGSVCSAGSGLLLYDSTPIEWDQVPEAVPAYPLIGYGATDNRSRELAFDVLRGNTPLPDRTQEDLYFVAYEQLRAVTSAVARGEPTQLDAQREVLAFLEERAREAAATTS
ncbi:MAG: S8 family serine peptidase [Thermoplasmatota archaeon]